VGQQLSETGRQISDCPAQSAEIDSPSRIACPPAGNTSRCSWRWEPFLAAGVIVLATLAVYANSFRGVFVFDDEPAIVNNPTIRHLWPVARLLSPPRHGETVSGRPLLNLTFALNYSLGGTNVWGYHVVNLAIHILAALTLFGILRRTFLMPVLRDHFGSSATLLALAIALLWALHPLQVESVTYIVQRAESLCGLFYLLVLYCVIRGKTAEQKASHFDSRLSSQERSGMRGTCLWYTAAVVACLLGVATKEVIVTAPIAVLLYDRTFLAGSFGQALRQRWGLYLGLAATWLLLAYLVLSTGLLGKSTGYGAPEAIGAWDYLRSQPSVILHYLRLSLWPYPICFDYGRTAVVGSPGSSLSAALVVGMLIAATGWGLVRGKAWAMPGAWMFLILAPTSLLPLPDLAFEHRMYLPLAGVGAIVLLGVFRLGQRLLQRGVIVRAALHFVFGFILIVMCIALGVLSARCNSAYRSQLLLWEDAVAKAPRSDRAHNNLAIVLAQQGRLAEAADHCHKALEIRPDDWEGYNNLGNILFQQGHSDEAIADYKKALEIKPTAAEVYNNLGYVLMKLGRLAEAVRNCQRALEIQDDYVDAHNNLGDALEQMGMPADAIVHYQKALELSPDNVHVYINLGNLRFRQGNLSDAIAYYRKVLEINPQYTDAHHNIGAALFQQGAVIDAIAHWREVIRLQPGAIATLRALAWALATSPAKIGGREEAVELAQRAAYLSGGRDPAALDTLAAAYAAVGRFSEAVQSARQAIVLAESQHNGALADKIRARISLYQVGTPYRDVR
jgi:tetratricopeptide (TPR) repeat protein